MKRCLPYLQAMLVYLLYGRSYLAITKASEVTGGDSYRLCAFRFFIAFLILTGLVKARILGENFTLYILGGMCLILLSVFALAALSGRK